MLPCAGSQFDDVTVGIAEVDRANKAMIHGTAHLSVFCLRLLQHAKAEDREVRGPVDHGFVRSIYFRDPNGYVIELTAGTGQHGEMMDPAISELHEALERLQAA